tara:strand:- start:1038 stop:1472 length:435 start_codon:yes stop_codon:yes gene_type:complete
MNVYPPNQVLRFLNKDSKYLNKSFDLMTKEKDKERKVGRFSTSLNYLLIDLNELKSGERPMSVNGLISNDLFNNPHNGQTDFFRFNNEEQIEIFEKYIEKSKSLHKDEMLELDIELDDMRDLIQYRIIEVSEMFDRGEVEKEVV